MEIIHLHQCLEEVQPTELRFDVPIILRHKLLYLSVTLGLGRTIQFEVEVLVIFNTFRVI